MDEVSHKYEIRPYVESFKNEWNEFVLNSKNGTFLLNRNYMDYHSDRFDDYSLMVFKNDKLYCLLPGNIEGDVFYSHKGLTYGGMILDKKSTVEEVLDIFKIIVEHLSERGVKRFVYKCIPHIYHSIPSEEDIYALFRLGASKIGCNISSTILLDNRIKFRDIRKSGIRKAKKNGITVSVEENFSPFWNILDNNLREKFGVKPVHNIDEINLLKSRFHNNIILHCAKLNDEIVAGVLMYLTDNVAHTQYISASPIGKELGALDLLFDNLINSVYANYKYFDFGQSTEENGMILNDKLIYQKEGFGGRAMAYNIYQLDIE